nr:LysM peptidoglycan-binding domain-containing protein [Clostridium felsineum]
MNRNHFLTYVFLSILTALLSILLIKLSSLYEYILLKRCELILYIVREGDSLISISNLCMPECNPWKTSSLIKKINHIENFIYIGQQIWIPMKI